MYELYNSIDFEKKYTYTGADLGVTWTAKKTMFRLWAPTADLVQIKLYKSGNPEAQDLLETLDMTQDVQGTWVATKDGDLNGTYYTYLVHRDGISVPYFST